MSYELKQKIPDPEVLLSLTPEELGEVLLPIFRERQRNNTGLNFYNYLNEFHQHEEIYPRHYQDRISSAINEAMLWLINSGLVAPNLSQTYGNWMFITRRGMELNSAEKFRDFKQALLLSPKLLHPIIAEKAWPTFIRGKRDTAVFEAFKEVEIAVRTAGNYDARVLGVDLMRKAFDSDNGPLTDMSLPASEREALSHLFAGAIGSYKNPSSHRTVVISESIEAGEMLILASHLMRIVEYRAARRTLAAVPASATP